MKIVCNRDFKNWDDIVSVKGGHFGASDELTYGKVYDILPNRVGFDSRLVIDSNNWWIINDKGQEQYYFKFMFVTLEEWRELQLNKLL
jgi:hypothetical protein